MEEVSALKIRIKFRKYGVMRFVGHLDIMRYFQKAMRRAEIPIAYSTGFSPHQIMSFASPLGVGLTSDGEYMDIELQDEHAANVHSKAAVSALNETMVDGMEVLSFRRLPDDAKTAMSIVAAADYQVEFSNEARMPDLSDAVSRMMAQSQILITKKTKKSEAVLDLKPLIYHMEVSGPSLIFRVAAGSAVNVKPSQVLEALANQLEETHPLCVCMEKTPWVIQTKRMELYAQAKEEGILVPLEALGEEIE